MSTVPDSCPTHTPEQLRRRRLLSRTWAFLVVGWSLVRALIVWAALGDYGVNPWLYLVIDLACSVVDAYTTPKTVLALVDSQYRTAARWGIVSAAVFIVPDVYIFVGSSTLPKTIIVVVCAVVVVTLTVTTVGVIRKVRAGRAERESAEALEARRA